MKMGQRCEPSWCSVSSLWAEGDEGDGGGGGGVGGGQGRAVSRQRPQSTASYREKGDLKGFRTWATSVPPLMRFAVDKTAVTRSLRNTVSLGCCQAQKMSTRQCSRGICQLTA